MKDNDRLTAIINSAMDAIIVTDDRHRITVFNAAAEGIFGCTERDAIGSHVERFIRSRLIAAHEEDLRQLAETGINVGYRDALPRLGGIRADGQEFPFEASIAQYEVDGRRQFTLIIRGISERKQVETVLRESEERFRLVANTAPVMIWMTGADKLCTYVNPGWLEFTGRSLEAELTSSWAEGIHPEELPRCLETYSQAFDRREPFKLEYRLQRRDGEYRWILDHGVPRFNANGSFAGYIGSAIDVTELKLAEARLQEYERAVEGLGEMMVVVDREYRYVIANNQFLKMRNMTKGQVVERFAHEVLNKGVFETEVKERLDECFQQGKVVRYEMKYTYPELGERDILVSYFPVEGRTGIDRVACIVQDITDRKRMEQAVRTMNQKLIEAHEEERTRIARELHDDINQRVAFLAVHLGNLKHRVPASAPELEQQIGDVRERMEDLAEDIQALSHRLHSPKLELLGLRAAAESFCLELSDRHGVKVDFHAENIRSELQQGISQCLLRVLQEALQNATKHSGVKQFKVSLRDAENEIVLTVEDSGVGFKPEEVLKGHGLGLTSMKERLRLVNGQLSIHSEPQHGTTIHARVPLAAIFPISKTRLAGTSGL